MPQTGATRQRFQPSICCFGNDDSRRSQQSTLQLVAGLYHLQHPVGFGRVRLLHQDRFVLGRIELLTDRLERLDRELLERAIEQFQCRLLPGQQRRGIGPAALAYRLFQPVAHCQ